MIGESVRPCHPRATTMCEWTSGVRREDLIMGGAGGCELWWRDGRGEEQLILQPNGKY